MSTSTDAPEAVALKAQIAGIGGEIKSKKTAKEPKDVWLPLVTQMNQLKLDYETMTGVSLNPPKKKKKKKQPASGEKQLSKKELRKLAKEKAAAEKRKKESAGENFGELPLLMSTVSDSGRSWARFSDLPSKVGHKVLIRGRMHKSRAQNKKLVFVVLRQGIHTVQTVLNENETNTRSMLNFAKAITNESLIDVTGTVTAAVVSGASLSSLEVQVESIHVVHKADPTLPFALEDACRSEKEIADGLPSVSLNTRLNYRHLDLRHPVNQAIFKVRSEIVACFREFLRSERFIEMHTPKIIGGASEGGAEVFHLKYFDQDACLAQSPQLYKQMVAACGGFERVFEVAPVFRAEKSQTHRHLCEFTGMDMEMAIHEHYYEVLDVFGRLFNFIFKQIPLRCKDELAIISTKYPCAPMKYCEPALLLSFEEGYQLLKAGGVEDANPHKDLSGAHEKKLGEIVLEKYGTDFFMMDKYPMEARPFYTMPDPENPLLSNSYDMFIRGQEIVSGAQRVHDPELLEKQALEKGVPPDSIREYINAFKHGALPHGGGGIGLDRVVFLYLGFHDIRLGTYFPRDPSRLKP